MSADASGPNDAAPNADPSPDAVAESGAAPPRGAGRGYLPDRRIGYLCLLSAIALGIAKFAMTDDSAFHIVLFVSTVTCGLALLTWFACFSGYPKALRVLVALAAVAALLWVPMTYRVQRFSGTLIPTIVRRDAPDPDAVLPEIVATQTVDLSATSSDDFPQFLGPQRDAVVPHVNLDPDWDAHPPTELWRRPIGAGWSGFAAVGGYAVTLEQRGEEELVTCYDIETGEPQWSSAIPASHASVLGAKGPRSTPTIHDGRVYAYGATGVLRCLDGSTGEEIWSRDFLTELGISQDEAEGPVAWGRAASPLIVDDKVVIPVGGDTSDSSITLMAIDQQTGKTVWESKGYQISYASPMLMTLNGVRQIVSVNENFVTGHDVETGQVLWEHAWDGVSNMNANCSDPRQVGDALVLLSKGYGKGGELIEISPDDDLPLVVWENKGALKTKFSNVSLLDGYAYALDDGVLSCVEVATGDRIWRKGRYRYGQTLLVGRLLLVMSEFGELALVEASPEAYRELGKVPVFDGQTWNTLCLYGNRLLVRNADEAACYELTLAGP
ncbi:MAG: PQQ-binding-like beta-propeller repeat protein [Planctomycetota bacterium]